MIIQGIILAVIVILSAIFSFLPAVTTLPSIGGYDVDGALSAGVGQFHTFITAIWPLYDVWLGFLFLLTYYGIKILLKFFLGHRAPGHHN